jgi:hypothetical protein
MENEFTPFSFMDFPFDAEVLNQEASQRSISSLAKRAKKLRSRLK